ncbi:MAG: hypothetical protein ABIP38_15205 [Steroidobacteraceae bacterium]
MKASRLPIACLVVAATASGCNTLEPPLADGTAVRALVAAQTADPGATQQNGVAIPVTDSVRAAAAIEAMRGGVTKPVETWTNSQTVGN